ncbi:phage tail tape measure protein, partial [Riemerella anatipestifer]|nr:phage tail tape measure protein [Riemerella anatipestifer]
MSNYTTTWTLNLKYNSTTQGLEKIKGVVQGVIDRFSKLGSCIKRVSAIDLMAIDQSMQNIRDGLSGITDIAVKNESALAEVSAITGAVGEDLEKLNTKAKNLTKTFGEDVNTNLDAFKTILSRLGPEIGNSDRAMEGLGESVNILSKTMEGDIKGATDAITTSMLQFQVDLRNPIKAAEESKRMINVMAAGAKEGAAEIPQISASLVQAGVSAKLANLSFEETNAAIQAMAEGGKYGSEAGVAIRNVITNMSAQTKLSSDAVKILDAYGINTKKMADTNVAWADRLRELKPIQNDINALTEVFGRENAAAAQILIRSADSQAELTQKITGTNVAYEQAAIIMDTSAEKEKRRIQRWNLFKIGIGNVTKHFQPFVNITATAVSVMANLKNAMEGVKIVARAMNIILGFDVALNWIKTKVLKNLNKEKLKLLLITNQLKLSFLWAAISSGGFSVALQALKVSIRGVSTAIMSIPVVGWILALISALIALFDWLWNNVGEFRGFFYGIWEVVKWVLGGVVNTTSEAINNLVDYFKWLWQEIANVFENIKNFIFNAWSWIVNKFYWAWSFIGQISSGISNTLRSVFGGVYQFFIDIFGGIWDYVSDVFDKIWSKIKGLLEFVKPLTDGIGAIWNKVKEKFNIGFGKGKKSLEDEKKGDGENLAGDINNLTDLALNTTGAISAPTPTIDYDKVFAKKEKGGKKGRKIGNGSSDNDGMSLSGSKGNRTMNVTVTVNNH